MFSSTISPPSRASWTTTSALGSVKDFACAAGARTSAASAQARNLLRT
jgi:hypothetical protein